MKKNTEKVKRFCLNKLDVSRKIASHLLGENHHHNHRMVIGGVVMFAGVILVKATMVFESIMVHVIGEVVGFGIHAIGAIPFISALEKRKNSEK